MAKRTSALSESFKKYGAEMMEAFDMETPAAFPGDPNDEHDAIREAIGMWDCSMVHKIRVYGEDALDVVNYVVASDVSKVDVGAGCITILLDENGLMDDDAMILRLEKNHYFFTVGDGNALSHLELAAKNKNVTVEYDSDTAIIALQGPKAVNMLREYCEDDIKPLKFFHLMKTRLFGEEITISRTGFSGERGYEFLISNDAAANVFEKLVEQGKPSGLKLCAFGSINMVRLEAGLPIGGMDFSHDNSPWEAGYGWAVSTEKGSYIGRDAALALKGKEKVVLKGVVADHSGPVDWGAQVNCDGKEAGRVTSSCYSKRMGKSIAFAQLKPEFAEIGTALEIVGENVSCSANVVAMPLYDPDRQILLAD